MCQSVPVFDVYPSSDDPHMIETRGTCPYRTQLKQNRVDGIRDVFHVRLHPALLRPLHIELREVTCRLVDRITGRAHRPVTCLTEIMTFPSDDLLSRHPLLDSVKSGDMSTSRKI